MKDLAGLPNAVRRTLERTRLPGMVIAACHGDGPIHQVAVGQDAAGRDLTVDTLFPVQSVTKLATALCALRLLERGDLVLDAPLREYLPAAAAASADTITIRTMLCHTSGLPATSALVVPWGWLSTIG